MNDVNWKNLKSSGASSLVVLGLLLLSLTAGADYLAGDLPDENVATLDYPMQQGIKGETYSFAKSKYALAKQVYSDYFIDFYGGCNYQVKEKLLVPVWSSCGFTPRKNPERAKRIEWEHIVPAWTFGHQLQCWQNGGRLNCRNTNAKFRQMEADMHNLVPAIGEINGDRSNFAYGMIAGETRPYGKPNAEIDFNAKLFEPDDKRFGDVARAYLYMSDHYGFRLSRADENLMMAWNNLDPVDEWEKKRNTRIANIQGNDNPYISNYKHLQRETSDSANETDSAAKPAPKTLPDNEVSQGNWFDKLYQWVGEHEKTIPFPIVLIVALFYWWFRGRKSTNKSTKKASTATTKKSSTKSKSS